MIDGNENKCYSVDSCIWGRKSNKNEMGKGECYGVYSLDGGGFACDFFRWTSSL